MSNHFRDIGPVHSTDPSPSPWAGPLIALAALAALVFALFGPPWAWGQVPEFSWENALASSSGTSYPEFTPNNRQRAILRSVGPVDCPSFGLQFETLEGLRQFLWSKPAWTGPWWGSMFLGACEVLEEGENGELVGAGEDAGALLQDTLAPPLTLGAPTCREHGFTGGHSSDFRAAWETTRPGTEPLIGQWFRVKCHHACGRVWCGDGGLLSSAFCVRAGDETPWAPGPFRGSWREQDWLSYLAARDRAGCPHPQAEEIREFFGVGEPQPPPPPDPDPPPPPPDPDPDPDPPPPPPVPDPPPVQTCMPGEECRPPCEPCPDCPPCPGFPGECGELADLAELHARQIENVRGMVREECIAALPDGTWRKVSDGKFCKAAPAWLLRQVAKTESTIEEAREGCRGARKRFVPGSPSTGRNVVELEEPGEGL